jgi:hypothetical protein
MMNRQFAHRSIHIAVASATILLGVASVRVARAQDATAQPAAPKTNTSTSTTTKKKPPKNAKPGAASSAAGATEEVGETVQRAIVGDVQENKNEAAARTPTPAVMAEKPKETCVQPGKAGQTTTTAAMPASSPAGVVSDMEASVEKPGRFTPFALEYQVLGPFFGGRLAITAEWSPATHHAILISPQFVHTTQHVNVTQDSTIQQSYTGGGGEIGYRYYSGRRGMNGLYIGPSVLAGVYNASLPDGDHAFTNIGLAVDAGIQAIIANHLIVGGGGGIEYLSVSKNFNDVPGGASYVAQRGLKPRVGIQVGYGF